MQYTQLDTAKITAPIAAKLSGISKTTVNGLVSCAIACIVAFTALPPGAKWPVVALALLRALVGQLQKDSGVQAAIPAGKTEPEMVPSHEEPNEAGAEVVK